MRALNRKAARLPAATDLGIGEELANILEGVLLHGYRLDQGRSEPNPGVFDGTLLVAPEAAALIEQAQLRANPVNRARAWIEQPANLLTPAVFADDTEADLPPLGVSVRKLGPDRKRNRLKYTHSSAP